MNGKEIKFALAGLRFAFLCYSGRVYTLGTSGSAVLSAKPNESAMRGKNIFQSRNCCACHQLFGLGGYLGPNLTHVTSDRTKGKEYCKAILKTGTLRMPDYKFTEHEINDLVSFSFQCGFLGSGTCHGLPARIPIKQIETIYEEVDQYRFRTCSQEIVGRAV